MAWGQDGSSGQGAGSGQTSPSGAPTQPTTEQTYQQEQRALAQEMQGLLAQGATPQQVQAWQAQNAVRLAAQQQRAQDMAAASLTAWMAHPLSMISEVQIPEGASPEMTDFLTTRADLHNRLAQLHNAQTPNADATFQQQNQAEIQAQTQRAAVIATQATPQAALPVPPPLVIPADATPQVRAYLVLSDQLMRERIALINQYVSSDPVTKNAALLQWQQQNADRFKQLQSLMSNLNPPTPN